MMKGGTAQITPSFVRWKMCWLTMKTKVSITSLKHILNKTFYDNKNNVVFKVVKTYDNTIKIPNIDLNTKEYSEILTTLKDLEINNNQIVLHDFDLGKIVEKQIEDIYFEFNEPKEKMEAFLNNILKPNVYFEKIIIYYRNAKVETKKYQQVHANYLKFKNKLLTLYRSIYLIRVFYQKKEDVVKYIPHIDIDVSKLPTMTLVL